MRQAIAAAFLLLPLGPSGLGAAAARAPCDTIAYRPDDRLVNIPVTIGSSRFWFDVDTGARHSVIDLAAAKRLGLPLIEPARMSGAGHGTAQLLHTSPLEIRAGHTSVRVAEPWVLDLSHTGTSRRIDGLVGVDFFKVFVVRIDPGAQTVAFCRSLPAPSGPSGTTIPLIVTNDRFFIDLKLTLPSGVAATHRVRVDTGSDDAVSDDLVRKSSTRRKSMQGVGLGTPYADYSGVLASAQIGPYVITNVWGPSGNPPAVGMEILRRFVLTFDARRRRLGLTPTARLHDPVPTPAP
ncbi:MAG TPA: retropepsin-like aspartic protease [Candidatus Cybelea sp.]